MPVRNFRYIGNKQTKSLTDGSGIAELYDIYASRTGGKTGYPHTLTVTSNYDSVGTLAEGERFGPTYTLNGYYAQETFTLSIASGTSYFRDSTGGSLAPTPDPATGSTVMAFSSTMFTLASGNSAGNAGSPFIMRLTGSINGVVWERPFIITEGTYSLSFNQNSYNEGSSTACTLTYSGAPPSETIYYAFSPYSQVGGNLTAGDVSSTVTGSFTSSVSGSGTQNINGPTLTNDAFTEGAETIQCRVAHYDLSSLSSYYLDFANATVNDTSLTPTASISASTTSVNEGSTVTFTINMSNFTSGNITWDTTLSADAEEDDITPNSGTVNISGSTGSVTITAVADGYTESGQTETFQFRVKSPADNTTVIASSSVITINDTSTGTPEPAGFTEFNLRVSSTPSGLTYVPNQSSLLTQFSSTYGWQTAGNASGSTYELYTTNFFSGDHLFECTVLFANSCSDPAIAIWTGSSTLPAWNWGTNSTRISLQQNCTTPYLYGTSQQSSAGSGTPTNSSNPITLHLHHQPSLSRTRAWVTTIADDWGNETNSRVGSIMQISNNYGSTAVRCGLSSDYDNASLSSVSTNFTKWRITPG